MIGVVTGFEYNDREYDVPTTKAQRRRFTNDLVTELKTLDGITEVFNAGTTQTLDSARLEIELETEERDGLTRVVPNLRSLSPRLRSTLREFTPVSSYEVVHTPTAIDADRGLYEDMFYIVEVWFY